MNAITKLSTKGQIVIPKDVRDALGWPEGQKLTVRHSGGRAIIEPLTPPRETIGWEEFRRRVPKYEGPALPIEALSFGETDVYLDMNASVEWPTKANERA